jgi:hypothetical protein
MCLKRRVREKKIWHKLADVKNMLLMVVATTEKNDSC